MVTIPSSASLVVLAINILYLSISASFACACIPEEAPLFAHNIPASRKTVTTALISPASQIAAGCFLVSSAKYFAISAPFTQNTPPGA